VIDRDKILNITPPGGPEDYILEIAARNGTGQLAQLLHTHLGYGHVRGCVSGQAGQVDTEEVALPEGGGFTRNVDHFDLERDFYPYPSAHFKAILCLEVIDTLTRDPMYMMDEIHRILRPGCSLILSTRRYTAGRIGSLLENCGLEVTRLETDDDCTYAAGRKIGALRDRYPVWLYPERSRRSD